MNSRCFVRLITAAVFVSLFWGEGVSQSASRPDRGTGANVPFSSSNVENINLQNGNVSLVIPLASLPPIAGGKLSFTLTAYYNSKLWNTYSEQRYVLPLPNSGEAGASPYDVEKPILSGDGGWRIGATYSLSVETPGNFYVPNSHLDPTPDQQILNSYSWSRTYFVTPDGSRHEIRPLGYGSFWGSDPFYYGFYKDTPATTNIPMRYYSIDGTYIWLTLYPLNHSLEFEAQLRDGTKIQQFRDGIQRIIDSNGNKIKIFTDAQGKHFQDEQTGREIRLAHNSTTGREEVWYETVGGVPEKSEIVFGTTTVRGKFYTVNVPNVYNGQTPSSCTFQENVEVQDISVVREIILPQTELGVPQPKYSFEYNSDQTDPNGAIFVPGCNVYPPTDTYPNPSKGFGELSRMTTPTGAVHKYLYSMDLEHVTSNGWSSLSMATNTISREEVEHDGLTDSWTYGIAPEIGASVTNADGSTSNLQWYNHFFGNPSTSGGTNGLGGLIYRETQSNKIMIERRWARLVFDGGYDHGGGGLVVFNPVVTQEYTTLLNDNGSPIIMAAKTFQYDYNGNLTLTSEYDWFDPSLVTRDSLGIPLGVPTSATVLRTRSNLYHNSPLNSGSQDVYAKTSISILNAIKEIIVGNSDTQFSYDNQQFEVAPTAGNLTSKSFYNDVDDELITTSTTYNSYGNVTSITDGRGNVTTFHYDDLTHAAPTRVVVDPENGTGTQTTTTAVDYHTGLVTSITDPNGKITSIDYTNQLLSAVDPFGRPGIVYGPEVTVGGSSQRHRVTTTYEDHLRRVTTATDLYAENDKLVKTRTTSDQLGRPILTEQTEDGSNYTLFSLKAYDTENRITYSSGPMRCTIASGNSCASASGQWVAASTNSWTRMTSDLLGRSIEIATFGGATQPPASGTTSVTGFSGVVATAYDANFTTVTDQAGKQRRNVVDAAGRLTRVDEPDKDSGLLDNGGTPVQPTSYDYDVFGNLRHVYQGSQTRTFTYDSLSRLRTATNPESGTISYSYDANGNLTQKIDPRLLSDNQTHVTTTFSYDALNRLITRSYNDGTAPNYTDRTPEVTYIYDTLTQNGKGRLTSVSSSVSTYSYNGYDAMGRVTGASQSIGAQSYPITDISYDLAGHLKTMTYPSGHFVTYNYDSAGRLADKDAHNLAFTGNLGQGGSPRTYASGISYSSFGGLQEEKFGTQTAIYHKHRYNSRGQLWDVRASTVSFASDPANGDRGAIVNYYSSNFVQGGNGVDNNGNLLRQELYIPGSSFFQDNFEYDHLNRLKFISEKLNGTGNPSFSQTYSYDRYGNRRINITPSETFGGVNNLDFDLEESTNRLYARGDLGLAEPSRSMRYDAAGNLWKDTYSGAADGKVAMERLYDAENRMTKETQVGNGEAGIYSYDGDGRRVKRVVGGVETWQVYGIGGELLAEYTSNGTQLSKEYGYRNGELLITATAATAGWGAPPTIDDNPLKDPNNPESFNIKAIHITQLRAAINALRFHHNRSNYQWVKPIASQGAINSTVLISWEPIDEMRTALNEALGAPTPPYAEGLALNQPILAVHIQELRNRVLNAWQSGGSAADIRWLVSDQLGTPRMVFDQTGSLANVSRHDYLPFGEEVPSTLRTGIPGYGANANVRQKFTSKERDNETGLDYFLARYYSSTQGRFSSVDPVMSSGGWSIPRVGIGTSTLSIIRWLLWIAMESGRVGSMS
jgi:RHS repeat-associated protein